MSSLSTLDDSLRRLMREECTVAIRESGIFPILAELTENVKNLTNAVSETNGARNLEPSPSELERQTSLEDKELPELDNIIDVVPLMRHILPADHTFDTSHDAAEHVQSLRSKFGIDTLHEVTLSKFADEHRISVADALVRCGEYWFNRSLSWEQWVAAGVKEKPKYMSMPSLDGNVRNTEPHTILDVPGSTEEVRDNERAQCDTAQPDNDQSLLSSRITSTDDGDRGPNQANANPAEEATPDKLTDTVKKKKIKKRKRKQSVQTSAHLGIDVIPLSFYPLILGPGRNRINEWSKKYNVEVSVANALWYEDNLGESNSELEGILIKGNQCDVTSVATEIEQLISDMEKMASSKTVSIPKSQHKNVIDSEGLNLLEIFEITGCIVELPPLADSSQEITVRGPADELAHALALIMKKVVPATVVNLDLSTLVPSNNFEGALFLLRYFLACETSKLKEFEIELSETVINFPSEWPNSESKGEVTLSISGKIIDDVEKVKHDIIDYVRALGTFFYTVTNIPEELYQQPEIQESIVQFRNKSPPFSGPRPLLIEILTPDERDEIRNLILVIFDPNKSNVDVGKQLTENIKGELEKTIQEATRITSQTFQITAQVYRDIIRIKGETLQDIIKGNGNLFPSLIVENELPRHMSSVGESNDEDSAEEREHAIVLKGREANVESAIEFIKKILNEVEQLAITTFYTKTVFVNMRYIRKIFGRTGSKIQSFKDISGVAKIEVANFKGYGVKPIMARIAIEGPINSVEIVVEKIFDIIEKLAGPTTISLNVPREYHQAILGHERNIVNRLESECQVRIMFPGDCVLSESGSVEDMTTARIEKMDENLNRIIVKGVRKGVDKAAGEIIRLVECEIQGEHDTSFHIPASFRSFIIDVGGSRITRLQQLTKTKISVAENSEPGKSSSEAKVIIRGSLKNIGIAKSVILKLVDRLKMINRPTESCVTEIYRIPKWLHAKIIGTGGEGIRALLKPYNCSLRGQFDSKSPPPEISVNPQVKKLLSLVFDGIDAFEKSCYPHIVGKSMPVEVLFPKGQKGSEDYEQVQIKGISRKLVNAVKADLKNLVKDLSAHTSVSVHFPLRFRADVIGGNNSQLRKIAQKRKVSMHFRHVAPEGEVPVNDLSEFSPHMKLGSIKISGLKGNCDTAVMDILALIPHTITVPIPAMRRPDVIGAEACNLKYIYNKFNVLVELPAPKKVKSKGKGGSNPSQSEVWTLKGPRDALVEVEKYIKELAGIKHYVDEALAKTKADDSISPTSNSKNSHITRKLHVPLQFHPLILGPLKITFTQIGKETNCTIEVPKEGSLSKVIVLKGAAEEVELAEAMIKEVLEKTTTAGKLG